MTFSKFTVNIWLSFCSLNLERISAQFQTKFDLLWPLIWQPVNFLFWLSSLLRQIASNYQWFRATLSDSQRKLSRFVMQVQQHHYYAWEGINTETRFKEQNPKEKRLCWKSFYWEDRLNCFLFHDLALMIYSISLAQHLLNINCASPLFLMLVSDCFQQSIW